MASRSPSTRSDFKSLMKTSLELGNMTTKTPLKWRGKTTRTVLLSPESAKAGIALPGKKTPERVNMMCMTTRLLPKRSSKVVQQTTLSYSPNRTTNSEISPSEPNQEWKWKTQHLKTLALAHISKMTRRILHPCLDQSKDLRICSSAWTQGGKMIISSTKSQVQEPTTTRTNGTKEHTISNF